MKGQYSIRFNDQCRICVEWTDGSHAMPAAVLLPGEAVHGIRARLIGQSPVATLVA